MFEPLISWDVLECLGMPDSAAIYSTKKPMNTGFTGYFFTFLLVEPAGQKPNTLDPDLVR
jgi:hypothetical protein